MDKLLPRHAMFIIDYGGKIDLLMHYKEMTTIKGEQKWACGVTEFQTEVQLIDRPLLAINGQNLLLNIL